MYCRNITTASTSVLGSRHIATPTVDTSLFFSPSDTNPHNEAYYFSAPSGQIFLSKERAEEKFSSAERQEKCETILADWYETKNTLLRKVELIWRNGSLFKNAHDPDSDFYINYLSEIVRVVDNNFVLLDFPGYEDFIENFIELASKEEDLTALQRSICLTQALELALLDIDTSSILKKINISHKFSSTHDDTIGYRQELLATWALTKFTYQVNQTNYRQYQFSPETVFYKPNREKYAEVDLVTPDAFVSVKSRAHRGGATNKTLTLELFSILTDERNPFYLSKIKKFFVVKSTHGIEPLKSGKENDSFHQNVRELILQDERLSKYLPYFDKLELRVIYIPFTDDTEIFTKWINDKYNESNLKRAA